jgi:hypothetical protein
MQAPLSWRSRHPVLPESPAAHLLQIPDTAVAALCASCASKPANPAVEKIVEALMAPQASHVTLLDEFPMTASSDSARFLVQLQPPGGSLRTYVVNAAASAWLGSAMPRGCRPSSARRFSSDGRYVIGHRAKQGAGTRSARSCGSQRLTAPGARPSKARAAPPWRASRVTISCWRRKTRTGDAVRLGRLQLIAP